MKRIQIAMLFFLMNASCPFIFSVDTIVGQIAPEFTMQAIINGEIKQLSLADFEGKIKVLVFYPADFSFICPTELFAIQDKLKEFEARNAIPIAISVDQIYSHQKWLETPKKEGGIQGITYPVAADVTKQVSNNYGVLDQKEAVALRGVFIIDEDNIVQASTVYNTSIGRNIDEILRVLDAIIFTKENGQVCPANWQKGKEGLHTTQKDLKKYLKKQNQK